MYNLTQNHRRLPRHVKFTVEGTVTSEVRTFGVAHIPMCINRKVRGPENQRSYSPYPIHSFCTGDAIFR
jgi:hypothetical protein